MWKWYFCAILGLAVASGCAPSGRQSEGAETSVDPSTERQRSAEADDGIRVSYSEKGTGRTSVVFIHGWSCDRSYWDQQFHPAAIKYRAVRLDLPGHGDSGSARKNWTIEAFGNDVGSVADQLQLDRMVLVGHSMGGPVALEAARRMPGRVIGVIGVDSLHNADFQWNETGWNSLLAVYEQDFYGTCDRLVRSMFLPSSRQELVKRVAEDMCQTDPAVGIALLRAFPVYDTVAGMEALQIPIRCINAAGMPTNVEGNRRYCDFDARLMEGVGHFLMLERPDEFNRLLFQTIAEIEG